MPLSTICEVKRSTLHRAVGELDGVEVAPCSQATHMTTSSERGRALHYHVLFNYWTFASEAFQLSRPRCASGVIVMPERMPLAGMSQSHLNPLVERVTAPRSTGPSATHRQNKTSRADPRPREWDPKSSPHPKP